jgi:hypothetical protein
LFRRLQNTQNLKNIRRSSLISQESTQNLERLEISKLPQIDWSKRRSRFVDHVSEFRFKFGGLDLQGSKVFGEKPKRDPEGAREI